MNRRLAVLCALLALAELAACKPKPAADQATEATVPATAEPASEPAAGAHP